MKPQNLAFALVVAVGVGVAGWTIAGRFGVVRGPLTASKIMGTNEGGAKAKLAYLTKDDPSIGSDDLGPRKWKTIDIHEHAKGDVEAQQLLQAMDKFGIQRTCLMGSTIYTLTLNPIYGFEGFKENNEALIAIKKKWPDRFCAFVTINPLDSGNLELLKDYVARGADGLKLYIGHGATWGAGNAFHSMPIDDPRMEPVFAWAEETQLPIVLHVNLEKYWDEMMHVLEKHPYLRVNMPHMGLHKNTEQRLKRLGFLLDRYPNAYTDMSFGYYTFQQDGFEVLAKNRTRSKAFITQHAKKMMYASDMVLEPTKDEPYILNTLRSYLQFLEQDRWRFFLVPSKLMHGMGLEDETLHDIYETAPSTFLQLDDKGMLPDRTHGWPPAGVTIPTRVPVPPLAPEMIPPLKAPPSTGPAPTNDDDKGAPVEAPQGSQAGAELEDDG